MKLYVNPNNGTVDDTYGAQIVEVPDHFLIPENVESATEILAWAGEVGIDITPL